MIVVVMETIEERANLAAWQIYEETILSEHSVDRVAEIIAEKMHEQKAIDDAKLLKLKSAWEKEAQTNHDDELNYKQGYHDAIEKALDWFSNYLDYLNMGICDENDWLRGSPESGKERFRKSMEE